MKSLNFKSEAQRKPLMEFFEKLDLGEGWVISLKPWKQARTIRQNSYLWGGIYRPIAEQISESTGKAVTPQHVHEICRWKFCPVETNPMNGKPFPKSTTKLTTAEFADYCDKVAAHAIEEWGVFFDSGRQYGT